MRRHGTAGIAVIGATLVAPWAAFAQTASVTVAPFNNTGVPVLGGALLGVLAVALGAVAVIALRRRKGATACFAAGAAALFAVAGYAAATTTTISGDECTQETTRNYTAFGDQVLESQCPNAIKIVAINIPCEPDGNSTQLGLTTGLCEVGLVLHNGDTCNLPICPE